MTVKGAEQKSNYFGNGAYAFRLLDTGSLPDLVTGQAVTTTRSPASSTIGYRFAATAGSALLLQASDSAGGVWRLLDPWGRQVSLVSGSAITTPFSITASGLWTLLNDGDYRASGSSNVSFTLALPSRTSEALAFNRSTRVASAGPGGMVDYHFTLDQATTLVFDALSGPESQWMLAGAQGTVQGWTPFRRDEGRILTLSAGRYVLSLNTASPPGSEYRFRVLDRDAAVDLLPGATVKETLPTGETRLYRFNASAGDRSAIETLNRLYGAQQKISWRLLDPFGKRLATLDGDSVETVLPVSGEYLLVVFPDFGSNEPDSAPRQIAITLTLASSRTALLTANEETVGIIERPAESVSYGFTLTAPATLLIDTFATDNDSSASWSLTGPRGSEATQASFTSPEPKLMSLPVGNYEFTVSRSDLTTGTFRFRLLDVATLPGLPFERPIARPSSAAGRTQAYRMVVDEDSEFTFLPGSLPEYDAAWRILDERGATRVSGVLSANSDLFSLPAGQYAFVVDGSAVDPNSEADHGSDQDPYSFTLRRLLTRRETMTLGAEVTGCIEQPGQRTEYSFSIDSPATVFFDPLSARTDLDWELVGPTGLIHPQSVFGGDGTVNPIRLEAVGAYRLRVIPHPGATGDFSFSLLDLGASEELPLDGPQTLVLDRGSSSRVFSFTGQAGDHLAFQAQSLEGGAVWLQVMATDTAGPEFSAAVVPGAESGMTLRHSGRHLFVLLARGDSHAPRTLAYTATRDSARVATLTVGEEASGMTRFAGLADQWQLSLNWPTRLLFDGLTASRNRWTLRAANGSLIKSGQTDTNTVLIVDGGEYTLAVQADTSDALGPYAFRLLDFAAAETLQVNQELRGTLASAHGARLFQVAPAATDSPLRIAAAATGGNSGELLVYDPNGVPVGQYAMPLLDPANLTGASGSGRLLVVDGVSDATLPMS